MDFKHRNELEEILDKFSLKKSDICLVGSMALSFKGIREHGDIDFCVPRQMQSIFKKGLTGNYLTPDVNLVKDKYERLIGISDDQLVTDPACHDVIEGYKVIKLELEFSAKTRRLWPKDRIDIPAIEKYIIKSKDWNWSLVRVNEDSEAKKAPRKNFIRKGLRAGELAIKAAKDPKRALDRLKEIYHEFTNTQTTPGPVLKSQILCKMPTAALVGDQYINGEFCRYDVLMRYLTIQSIDKGNKDFDQHYKKMQKLRADRETYENAVSLVKSIRERGFLNRFPVPISRNGYIIDGSHRVACALYFDIDELPVQLFPFNKKIDYSRKWFIEQGFDNGLVNRLDTLKDELFEKKGIFFSVILWPPVHELFDEISERISKDYSIKWKRKINLGKDFASFARRIYAIDDIETWKVERKLHAMKDYKPQVCVLAIEIPDPKFRKKKRTQSYLSDVGASLKKSIRTEYRNRVPGYIYDIICHTGDNHEHNSISFRIINEYSKKHE